MTQGGAVIAEHLVDNSLITKNSKGMNNISMGKVQVVEGLGNGGISMTQGIVTCSSRPSLIPKSQTSCLCYRLVQRFLVFNSFH